ncbi:AMP-binding protein, partial [Xanthomonas maliensis]|uniref:AMP-binding protein n=1 Tax=Xanthomonas maliensis TaxID=1321368 RepID=UPI002351DD4C
MDHRLRVVIFGGEALDVATLRPWFQHERNLATHLVNMYGITETTVHVTSRSLAAADVDWRGGSPIGCPLANTRVYILDGQRAPVPIGVVGELYIGGGGVSRGYLNRAELTAQRFLVDPFSDTDDARMYRSGDLGRWRADGTIEFMGRNDHQVKIRGFRIELGEIEARLSAHDAVRACVVVALDDAASIGKRLVAYWIGAEGGASDGVDAEALRHWLSATLPDYMVPAAYVQLEALPLTLNGKLDRRALPAPDANALAVAAYDPPQGELEIQLAALWRDLLGVEQVGRHDNFFALGGHSLLGVRLISRIRSELGLELPLAALFAKPQLA